MKKKLLGTIALCGALLLSACTGAPGASSAPPANSAQGEQLSASVAQESSEQEKMSIVTTSFHEYDWINEILGDNKDDFEVTLLMDNGVDLHSYEPSVEDISKISSAYLFVYNGGLSHDWVADVIAQPMNENLKTVNVMETLGEAVKNEVAIEGMQSGGHSHYEEESTDEHSHEEESADEHAHEEEHETAHTPHEDEHVWLSLNNAISVCNAFSDEIVALDPENADVYKENTANYTGVLSELDEEYKSALEQPTRDTLIFADRFPFLYMMQDYHVNYFAAFQGCSAETEANIETIAFLAEKVNEYDVNYVLIIDNGLHDVAATVISNSEHPDAQTLVLNSMQSVSQEQIDAGATYFGYMQENLEILKQALS